MRKRFDEIYVPNPQGEWDAQGSQLVSFADEAALTHTLTPPDGQILIYVGQSPRAWGRFTLHGLYRVKPVYLGTALFYDVTDDDGQPWRVWSGNFAPMPDPEPARPWPLKWTLIGIAIVYALFWLVAVGLPAWLPPLTD